MKFKVGILFICLLVQDSVGLRIPRQAHILSTTPATNDCSTPDGRPGLCRPAPRCPPIFKVITTKPFPADMLPFLKKSECSELENVNGRSQYCCPKDGELDTVGATTLETPTEG